MDGIIINLIGYSLKLLYNSMYSKYFFWLTRHWN